MLARVTQPVLFAGMYFDIGLRFYWVLLANAATYALIGVMAETLRQGFGQRRQTNGQPLNCG